MEHEYLSFSISVSKEFVKKMKSIEFRYCGETIHTCSYDSKERQSQKSNFDVHFKVTENMIGLSKGKYGPILVLIEKQLGYYFVESETHFCFQKALQTYPLDNKKTMSKPIKAIREVQESQNRAEDNPTDKIESSNNCLEAVEKIETMQITAEDMDLPANSSRNDSAQDDLAIRDTVVDSSTNETTEPTEGDEQPPKDHPETVTLEDIKSLIISSRIIMEKLMKKEIDEVKKRIDITQGFLYESIVHTQMDRIWQKEVNFLMRRLTLRKYKYKAAFEKLQQSPQRNSFEKVVATLKNEDKRKQLTFTTASVEYNFLQGNWETSSIVHVVECTSQDLLQDDDRWKFKLLQIFRQVLLLNCFGKNDILVKLVCPAFSHLTQDDGGQLLEEKIRQIQLLRISNDFSFMNPLLKMVTEKKFQLYGMGNFATAYD